MYRKSPVVASRGLAMQCLCTKLTGPHTMQVRIVVLALPVSLAGRDKSMVSLLISFLSGNLQGADLHTIDWANEFTPNRLFSYSVVWGQCTVLSAGSSIDGAYCRDFLVALSAAARTRHMMQERTRNSDPILTLPAARVNKLPIKQ
jgi:hypothetical protein